MAVDTFSWVPSYTSRMTRKPSVLEAEFGDGYVQDSPEGINSTRMVYTLVFDVAPATADLIDAFLAAHVGLPFIWTPPRKTALRWRCNDEWGVGEESFGLVSVTATFKQDFAP
jgi:phage-related protein